MAVLFAAAAILVFSFYGACAQMADSQAEEYENGTENFGNRTQMA